MTAETLPSRRVYVLGAGMSIGSGIPGMAALTRLVFSEPYNYGLNDDLTHFCGFAFPGMDMELDMDGLVNPGPQFDLNIEEFMAALDAYVAFVKNTNLQRVLPFRADLLMTKVMHMIGRCIRDLGTSPGPQPYLTSFVRALRPGDVVITFNWDTLLEQTLAMAEIRHSFPECGTRHGTLTVTFDEQTVTVVKVHGSVDWRRLGEGPTEEPAEEVLYSSDGEAQVVRTARDFEPPRLEHLGGEAVGEIPGEVPFLIPPSHFKTFPWRGLSGALWYAAFLALGWAERVTIIGYSLPVTDYLPRWLLRAGLLFNRETGREYLRRFWGAPSYEDLEEHYLQGMSVEEQVRELRAQALQLGNQQYMRMWSRSIVPVTVINPDPAMHDHFKHCLKEEIEFIGQTAEAYFAEPRQGASPSA